MRDLSRFLWTFLIVAVLVVLVNFHVIGNPLNLFREPLARWLGIR
jgi:hypothetical protein